MMDADPLRIDATGALALQQLSEEVAVVASAAG